MLDKREIRKARLLLDEGEVVGIPTETVYGLAARVDIPSAIEKIFKTKDRPFFDPLIVHVSSVAQAKKVTAYWGLAADVLAEVFWPGPLTLILPKDPSINSMITSGLESVGIRMPQHPMALALIESVGVPLAAPSANKFGRTSPTLASHVRAEFSTSNVFVLDGGECDIGIESTVLAVRQGADKVFFTILRKGHVLRSDIEREFNLRKIPFEFIESAEKTEAPGMMKHHYMPSIPLIVSQDTTREISSLAAEASQRLKSLPAEVEGVKIFKPEGGIKHPVELKLSEDPVIASREFYAKLRSVVTPVADSIVFYRQTYHQGERWESLFDRMNKAASLIL